MRILLKFNSPRITIRYRSPHPRSNGKDRDSKDNATTTKDTTNNPTAARENSGMLEEQYDSEFLDATVLEPTELNNNGNNNINTLNTSTLSSLSTRIKPHRYQSTSSMDEEEQQAINQLPPLFPQEDGQGI